MTAPVTPQGAEDDAFTFSSTAAKEYPLCPEGPANVIVSRAQLVMKKKPAKFVKATEDANKEYPYINLMLQTDKKYEQDGEQRPHNIFYSMKVSDHAKATMTDFFLSVLGTPVPLSTEKTIKLTVKKETRDDKQVTNFPQFVNMQFSIVVKHKASEDGSKTFDNVDSIFATPEQKASNAAMFSAGA